MERFNAYIERNNMDKKAYQYEGVEWLLQNELRNHVEINGAFLPLKGGFLADEMGLGKTIMLIGLCLSNFKQRTLIVVPAVLIEQWFNQIYRTTGHKCLIYHGENKTKINKKTLEEGVVYLEKHVIVLCSYDAINITRKNKKKNMVENVENVEKVASNKKKTIENSLIHRIQWGRIIFDEAHHLRNKNTNRYFGAKLLHSEIKWLVSGTPIQNKKQDFYALCSLLNLPASYFSDVHNLGDLTNKFILKRTKKQVGIDLNDAVISKKIVSWNNEVEMKLSKKIHSFIHSLNAKFNANRFSYDGEGQGEGEREGYGDVDKDRGKDDVIKPKPKPKAVFDLLPLLNYARQSCIYPKMLEKKFYGKVMGKVVDRNVNVQGMGKADMENSSKLDSVVQAVCNRKNNGNGKIVFCHFREEMNEIAKRLRNLDENLQVALIDGRISKKKRTNIFNKKQDVLIMQIQTGCEGLNLQDDYNEIYFVSPHWNPYIEEQAIARCHRIGQKKEVFVWRFEMGRFESDSDVCGSNMEEYISEIQNKKRYMVEQILI